MREYLGSLAKGKVWLFAPQPVLLVLTFFKILPILYTAPIIVALATLWGWLDYTKKTARTALELLSQFEVLLADFGRLNFVQGGEGDDKRIVKLLDIVPPDPSTMKPEVASATIPRIKDMFIVFEFWYFSMCDKVRIMIRRAGVLLDYDLVDLASDFVEFYNRYLDKIAEGTLTLVSKQELVNSKRAREILRNSTENLSELRGRANAFLKELRGYGYSISGMDIRSFGPDPWADLTAVGSQSPTNEHQ